MTCSQRKRQSAVLQVVVNFFADTLDFAVSPTTTVRELKHRVQEEKGIPIRYQRLVSVNAVLLDEVELVNYATAGAVLQFALGVDEFCIRYDLNIAILKQDRSTVRDLLRFRDGRSCRQPQQLTPQILAERGFPLWAELRLHDALLASGYANDSVLDAKAFIEQQDQDFTYSSALGMLEQGCCRRSTAVPGSLLSGDVCEAPSCIDRQLTALQSHDTSSLLFGDDREATCRADRQLASPKIHAGSSGDTHCQSFDRHRADAQAHVSSSRESDAASDDSLYS